MEIPGLGDKLHVNIGGQQVDLGPLLGKLMGDGVKLGDIIGLALPLLFAYLQAPKSQPVPQPAPPFVPPAAPVPVPPVVTPPVVQGEPPASLKINAMWRKKQGAANTESPVNLQAIGWGDKVAFDCNAFDKAGNKRADLVHGPIHWHYKWDGGSEGEVYGDLSNGAWFAKGGVEAINLGSKEYFDAEGAVVVVKNFKDFADANRHQVDVWCDVSVANGSIVKSNVVSFFVN